MAVAERVAVMGAGGTMGAAMARNLARAGHEVRAWNRTRAKAESLAADGALVVGSPAEAVEGASVLLTMLADADAVAAVMEGEEGALGAASRGLVWLQMGTIGEEGTSRCAGLARERGLVFVDAPVLGTKEPAEKGALVVLASGPEDARERVQPLFDVVGSRTLWVGEAGRGSLLKLVTNSWIMAVVEGAAETIALAEGLGLDPALLLEAVEGGPLDIGYLHAKGMAMAARDFTPSFRLALAAKDAGLVDEAARRRGMDLPMVAAIRARLEASVAEHGHEDVAATFLASAPRP